MKFSDYLTEAKKETTSQDLLDTQKAIIDSISKAIVITKNEPILSDFKNTIERDLLKLKKTVNTVMDSVQTKYIQAAQTVSESLGRDDKKLVQLLKREKLNAKVTREGITFDIDGKDDLNPYTIEWSDSYNEYHLYNSYNDEESGGETPEEVIKGMKHFNLI